MRWVENNFSRWHVVAFVVLWSIFSALTFYVVSNGLDNAADHPGTVAATTAATVLGPMTGAVSRNFQGCCLGFSLSLLPYCLSGLLVAVLAQVIRLPAHAWGLVARRLLWILGLFVWFAGGIVSFMHALS